MGYILETKHLKKTFKNAYYKVISTKLQVYDDEVYVIDDEGNDILTFEKKIRTEALFYIYEDKEASELRLNPMKQFILSFDYDLLSCNNIIKQAYNALKENEDFKGGVDN